MQSTGVLNLSIGLTGVKKNRGDHLSYMFLARAAGLCFSFSLHAAVPPLAHAAAAARSTRRRPEPLSPRVTFTARDAARALPARARAALLAHRPHDAAAIATPRLRHYYTVPPPRSEPLLLHYAPPT